MWREARSTASMPSASPDEKAGSGGFGKSNQGSPARPAPTSISAVLELSHVMSDLALAQEDRGVLGLTLPAEHALHVIGTTRGDEAVRHGLPGRVHITLGKPHALLHALMPERAHGRAGHFRARTANCFRALPDDQSGACPFPRPHQKRAACVLWVDQVDPV